MKNNRKGTSVEANLFLPAFAYEPTHTGSDQEGKSSIDCRPDYRREQKPTQQNAHDGEWSCKQVACDCCHASLTATSPSKQQKKKPSTKYAHGQKREAL